MDLPGGVCIVRRRTPLKADPFAQKQLLALQAVDSTLHTLRHQRANLPEQAQLVDLVAEREPVQNRARDAQIVVEDLTVVLAKAETDVEQVKARRDRDQQRLDSGAVSNPKDLERLQNELGSLARRVEVLEEEQLEVMEQMEAAQASLQEVSEELSVINARGRELIAARDERGAQIDAEIASIEPARAAELTGVPAALLNLYDRLRDAKGGIGAAELRRRQCNGCMLTLDNAELSEIKAKPVDEVVQCNECDRILVRTEESGL